MNHARNLIEALAHAAASTLRPRQLYATDVLAGRQNWSGSDLKGKAKRFGGEYARQRSCARAALFDAGGLIVAGRHGELVTALPVATDDFGNQVYATGRGFAIPATRAGQVRPL